MAAEHTQCQNIHVACETGNTRKLQTLMMDVNHINGNGYTPLHVAILADQLECVQLLLSDGQTRVNTGSVEEGNTALHFAVLRNQIEMVRLLVDKRANPWLKNDDQKTSIQVCTDPAILDLLQNAEGWSSEKWLHNLGLPQYITTFERAQLDSERQTVLLKRKEIEEELSATDPSHRNTLADAIRFLKKTL